MFWKIITKLFTTLATLFILVIVSLSAYLALSTSRVQRQPLQEEFLSGSADLPLPGAYRGQTNLPLPAWRGKSFQTGTPGGTNYFSQNGAIMRLYPFIADTAPGLRDHDISVIRLDYNQAANPWYVRVFLVEEIVRTSENNYLGKTHIRILPSLAFTLDFFTLQPAAN